MYKVNNHIHTPYSFSAFKSIKEAFELAEKEGIQVLGINDFFVTDGYAEFNKLANEYLIYPTFNVEFIGLLKKEQAGGIRVNDPSNPGRTYFCGKALSYPVSLSKENQEKLDKVVSKSQEQVKDMLNKLAELLKTIDAPFSLSFEEIKEKYARELVRERHIAQGLRNAINEHYPDEASKSEFIKKLYFGNPSKVDLSDNNSFEGELRSRLLKAGGTAFVAEEESSFLPIPELVNIIINAGGIPCYPVLLDDKNGNYTEFEGDKEALLNRLKQLNVGAVELIPGRNNIDHLRSFVKYFHENDFLVSFGTEHNTPEMTPMEVKAGGNTSLDEYLLEVNEETACIYIAHQELISKKREGYLDSKGHCKTGKQKAFIDEGKLILANFLKN